jgi:hypothetical protein
MCAFDTVSVREGIRLYLAECSNDLLKEEDAAGKIYAFHRVFFRIEDRFYATATAGRPYPPEIQSFWGSPRDSEGRVNLLWPYAIDSKGDLILQNVQSIGDRTGPGYSPLVDFDCLVKHFGRRFDPK